MTRPERSGSARHVLRPEDSPRLITQGSIWILIAVPSIWAAHFLLSYWIAAIYCAKLAGPGPEGLETIRLVRWTIIGLTILACLLILWLGRIARHRYEGPLRVDAEINRDTKTDRNRFLGHVTLLLCGISIVAIVFTAIPSLVFDACR
jgi:biotin transporter BioY